MARFRAAMLILPPRSIPGSTQCNGLPLIKVAVILLVIVMNRVIVIVHLHLLPTLLGPILPLSNVA